MKEYCLKVEIAQRNLSDRYALYATCLVCGMLRMLGGEDGSPLHGGYKVKQKPVSAIHMAKYRLFFRFARNNPPRIITSCLNWINPA
jgi:hypothetical protein